MDDSNMYKGKSLINLSLSLEANVGQIESSYEIRESGKGGFLLGEYNKEMALKSDPVLVYSTFLGGNNNDYDNEIAVDGVGNAYITGYTYSSDLSETLRVYNTPFSCTVDGIIINAGEKSFTMEKTVDKPGEYYVKGDQIIFFITLTLAPNQGALPNMDLVDTISPQVSITSVNVIRGTGDNPQINGQTITVTNVTLAASEENRIYQLQVMGKIV